MSEKPSATPRHDLAEQARVHYEELSNAACSWNSVIPQAIDTWERDVNRWIPVTERLPTIEETHNDDALFVWNGEMVRACFNPYGSFKNGNVEDQSFYTQDENGYDYQLHFVTHWITIPGPTNPPNSDKQTS
jgi:hypothetical protein